MSSSSKSAAVPRAARPAAVYLIQRRDRLRFKLGISLAPLQRARMLPEFHAKELDLKSSLALWLPDQKRAAQVERGMHKCLAPFAAQTTHWRDGHTEWFLPDGFLPAVRILQQMPKDKRGIGALGLYPLVTDGAVLVDKVLRTPREIWWSIEDLLLRLANELPVSVALQGEAWCYTLSGFRPAWGGELPTLRPRVTNLETFSWHMGTASGNFLSIMDYDGDALVLQFQPRAKIRRWFEGDTLNLLMSALMARLTARFGNAQEVPHG